jgi:crotonobetainyl-CoA:carnitine CoA-transferase CaiB-like acyl-CoA transferase
MVTPMLSYMTGILAALGATAAVYLQRRGGPAQPVSVSGLQAAFALNTGTYITGPTHSGSNRDHGEPRGATPTYGIYPTRDGWVFVGALTEPFWVKLATLLDRVDLLADERLQSGPFSFATPGLREFVRAELEPHFRERSTADWVDRLRAADIPCGAVGTRADFLRDPEARALGLATPIDDPVLGATWQPPPPATFSDTPTATPCAAGTLPDADGAARGEAGAWAPRPRAHGSSAANGCLAGVRVLDVTSFIAGPVCPMLLADLGADVIKIESPEGDSFRAVAFGFVGWNRGKRSLVLDLRRPDAQAVFHDLARAADVVVDNVRVGVLERLGIGCDTLHALNPRLIHLSITGFGTSGALTTLPGFDPVFQSRSGLMQAQGGDDEPVFHAIAYNDYCAGGLGALAVCAALLARERTGRGQRVDVSLFRTAFVDQAADMVLCDPPPATPRGGRDFLGPSAAQRLYHCRDGWVCVSARTDAERAGLTAITGEAVHLDAAADGPAAWAVAAWCAARTRDDAMTHLSALGVPVAPCLTPDELWTDPLLRASGVIGELIDPALGKVIGSGPLISFGRTPTVLDKSAPALGGDADSVLGEIGYAADRIAALQAAGAVGRPR